MMLHRKNAFETISTNILQPDGFCEVKALFYSSFNSSFKLKGSKSLVQHLLSKRPPTVPPGSHHHTMVCGGGAPATAVPNAAAPIFPDRRPSSYLHKHSRSERMKCVVVVSHCLEHALLVCLACISSEYGGQTNSSELESDTKNLHLQVSERSVGFRDLSTFSPQGLIPGLSRTWRQNSRCNLPT